MKYKALWITIGVIALIAIILLSWKVWKDKQDAAALLAGQTITTGGRSFKLVNGVVTPVDFRKNQCIGGKVYVPSKSGDSYTATDVNCNTSMA